VSNTVHRGGYTIKSRPYECEDEDWDLIFKRDKKNQEKNRYKRSDKEKRK
jgi:hypothetical protein